MQIKKIILYSKNSDNKPRVINFNTGALNIITGESKSGKSALVGIIDYCLGSKSCNIYDGIIRRKTEFFSIVITFGDEDVFISRLNPDVRNKSTIDEIFVKRSYTDKELPLIEEFVPNFNTSLLKSFL
jgi:DNA repair ATPase RecN